MKTCNSTNHDQIEHREFLQEDLYGNKSFRMEKYYRRLVLRYFL